MCQLSQQENRVGALTRTRDCIKCEKSFTYLVGKGNDRRVCSLECRRLRHRDHAKRRHDAAPLCRIAQCGKKATRVGAGLCEACYCLKRTKGIDPVRGPRVYKPYKTPVGYIKLWKPEHPLADGQRQVFEHRAVLFDSIGHGPHPCHWCEAILEWRDIVVDHLNEAKDDNRIENLVVSCNGCNRARGAMLSFIRGMTGERFDVMAKIMRQHTKTGSSPIMPIGI